MPRITRVVTAALAILALGVPVATAMPAQDNAGTAATQQVQRPGWREAALAQERSYMGATATPTAPRQDMRSPDTRDIAEGRTYPATPTVVTLKQAPNPVPAAGFDWGAALAGAGTALAVLLLGAAAAALVVRHRAHGDQPVAAA